MSLKILTLTTISNGMCFSLLLSGGGGGMTKWKFYTKAKYLSLSIYNKDKKI